MEKLNREIFLSFWKVHILYHAEKEGVYGQWMIKELRRHGYDISPGTLYPILERMEEYGWIASDSDPGGGAKARKNYTLTQEGKEIIKVIKEQVKELYREVVLGDES